MAILKITTAFLLISIVSCGQKQVKHKVDPEAVLLNNQAMTLVASIENPDSSKKALALLDKATSLDSNYFLGYANKLMFLYQLKEFDKAIFANSKLIQLQPLAHDHYLRSGILYEQMGNTVTSKEYFNKSLTLCNVVLDTMSKDNKDFVMFTTNKAVNLIMLDETEKANKILRALYDGLPDDPEFGNLEKKYVQSLLNKTKRNLIDSILNGSSYSF